ncbi:hypothetical protein BGW36DRAFT_379750 [Talaromyces proteolyticus]|uniref:Zn(2)-C6 fungal-type domain-containing protein n=1 Tax=Talaromyces proteolyticus TaxID=1131652 RepID=A0AAD4KSV3_9EURO|nr:uncharacterized protein BGW36DRAFT_379750 [Talaromyces proteolyticus]KAH8697963.1 hypothetical protein BGW36DRAFT_379750 [Talaromyces proteolyticus]
MIQATQACDACRDRKKRCDKVLPECSECRRRQAQCQYSQKAEEHGMVESLWQKLNSLECLVRESKDVSEPRLMLPFSRLGREIQYDITYPVSKRWYFPMLLHFRFHSMVPSIKNISQESAAYKLRTAWVTGYLRDPAMFHAILHAASANLDLINGETDNPVTYFHGMEAIRLTKSALSCLESHDDLPHTVLATTWALAHVARLTGKISEAHVHEAGLRQMVRSRDHSTGLGFDGALSFLIMLSDIWNSIINEEDASLEFIDEHQNPYLAQPRRTLLSTALERALNEELISNDVIFLLRMVDHSQAAQWGPFYATGTSISTPSGRYSTNPSPHDGEYLYMLLQAERLASYQCQDHISECCCLAAMIYWKALFTNVPFNSPDNDSAADQLFIAFRQTDLEKWMEKAPEMHIWVSYVGALASANKVQRASFVAISKTSVVILSQDRILHFQDGVSHLLCLSRHLRQLQSVGGWT